MNIKTRTSFVFAVWIVTSLDLIWIQDCLSVSCTRSIFFICNCMAHSLYVSLLNLFFICAFPWLYRMCYCVYPLFYYSVSPDSIHMPDWHLLKHRLFLSCILAMILSVNLRSNFIFASEIVSNFCYNWWYIGHFLDPLPARFIQSQRLFFGSATRSFVQMPWTLHHDSGARARILRTQSWIRPDPFHTFHTRKNMPCLPPFYRWYIF